MTPRQAYALTHPLDYADGAADALAPLRQTRRRGALILMTILAVDR